MSEIREMIDTCFNHTPVYSSELENIIYRSIKFQFPNIKNLDISNGLIVFDDDGVHTEEMVKEFITNIQKSK